MKNTSELREKNVWEFAFGLIKIDDLVPTEFLKELANMEIEGKISTDEILDLLIKKYKVSEYI